MEESEMASTSWLRWIGLGLFGAGVGYLRARARRPEEPQEPIDLPVAAYRSRIP